MKPVVSIIIPSYNRAHCIGETLQSVISQTYEQWECIVIDDGSTDSTMDVVNAFAKTDKRIQLFKRPLDKKKGANACRNMGITKSSGDYLIFLDSDDLLAQEALENRVQVFQEYPKLDFAVFGVSYFYPDGSVKEPQQKNVLYDLDKEYLNAFLAYDIPWVITSPIWKKEVCVSLGWDEDLKRLQDVDFHIRALVSNDFSFKRFRAVDTKIRAAVTEKGGSKDHVKSVLESLDVYVQKVGLRIKNNQELRKAFKKCVLFFEKKYLLPAENDFPDQVKKIRQTIHLNKVFTLKESTIKNWELKIVRRSQNGIKTIGAHRIHQLFKKTFKIP